MLNKSKPLPLLDKLSLKERIWLKKQLTPKLISSILTEEEMFYNIHKILYKLRLKRSKICQKMQ